MPQHLSDTGLIVHLGLYSEGTVESIPKLEAGVLKPSLSAVQQAGVHKTGIRGIQDTRQIVDCKTNYIENNDKKGGSKVQTLNIRQFMKKAV